jgi:hypothetical protein
MRSLTSLLLLALFLPVGPLRAAEAVDLKSQFLVGKKYFQTMEMAQESTFSFGPQTMHQQVNMTMEISTAVRPHEDQRRKRLTVTFDRMVMKMNMNGQQMDYDSAKPGEDPMGFGKAIGQMVGKEIRAITNEKDEVTELENFEQFAGAAGSPIGQMFTKESMTEMMRQSGLKALPGHPVSVGESWPFTSQMKLAQLGDVAVKGTYTLKSVGEHNGIRMAEIATDATLSIDFSGVAPAAAEAPAGAPSLAALGMKIEGGKMAGTIWFDPALGTVRESVISQEMEMTMNNPVTPGEKVTVPMKQIMTQKLQRIEDLK